MRGTRFSPFVFLAPALLCRQCLEEAIPYEQLCRSCHYASRKDHVVGGFHTRSPQERYPRNWILRRREDSDETIPGE